MNNRRRRILIANRDQTFLDQLVERLLSMNMDVDFANEGKSAVELIEAEEYDLIVLDVALPIHNGLEILELVKHLKPNTPVLMITFSGTQDWAEQALRQGAYGYLLRPLEDMAEFDRAVRDGLTSGSNLHQMIPPGESFYAQVMSQRENRASPGGSVDHRPDVKMALPSIASGSPKNGPSPMADLARKNKSFQKNRQEQLVQVIDSLPDGILELNSAGQILSCNPTAREWLTLEATAPHKPLTQVLKAVCNTQKAGKTQVEVQGRNALILVKPIRNKNGEERKVVMIRDASQLPQAQILPHNSNRRAARKTGEEIVEFKNVARMSLPETQEQGWSLLVMVDKVKSAIRFEVEKFLEDNHFDWLEKVLEPEPEEIDPEVLSAVSHRLSKIR
jgi:CheY-like chemotaxis protein